MKPRANHDPVFAALIEDVRNTRGNGSDIEDEVICLLFLRALPDEYSVFRERFEPGRGTSPLTALLLNWALSTRRRNR